MASWTPATSHVGKSRTLKIIGQHRKYQETSVSKAPDVDVWPDYASAAKQATGTFMEAFFSSLCIQQVHFVGGLACIPSGGMVPVCGWVGLGFADRMIDSGVPGTIARTWEGVVGSAVYDYFRSFQIFLNYPTFIAHHPPYAGPTPNVPVSLSQGFSGAIHLVLAPILTNSLQAKLELLASDQSDRMESATAGYASWFAERLEQGMRATLINDVMAEGKVLGQFVGPVKARLDAPIGFLARSPISIFFAD